MAQQNYKLQSNHAATIGHVREAYQLLDTKIQNKSEIVDENQEDGNKYKLKIANNQLEFYRGASSGDMYYIIYGTDNDTSDSLVQKTNRSNIYISSDSRQAIKHIYFNSGVIEDFQKSAQMRLSYGYVDNEFTDYQFTRISSRSPQQNSVDCELIMYPKTTENQTLVNKARFNQRLGYVLGSDLQLQDNNSILSRSENDLRYKAISSLDSKIQNSTQKTAVSCDGDLYISVKSNNNKLCDIHEDQVNQGMTINTYNKRLNLVSNQPQTFYHNSPASLFNFKYTDDGNTTAGQARFGQIQLAPSNTTNLNPALTLVSSRINGLGNAGAIFLDSTYGVAPLILSPQSLTDAGGNQFTMLRSTVSLPAGSLRNTFNQPTGYASGVQIQNALQFTTKQYVDDAIANIDTGDIDLSNYVQKTGDQTITGNISAPEPQLDQHLATKFYVDQQIAGIDTGSGSGSQSTLIESNTLFPYKLTLENAKVKFSDTDQVEFLQIFSETNRTTFVQKDRGLTLYEKILSAGSQLENVSMASVVRDVNRQAIQEFPQLQISQHKNNEVRLSAYQGAATSDNQYTRLYLSPPGYQQTNHIVADKLIGYKTAPSTEGNDLSILSRAQNDGRYLKLSDAQLDRLQALNFQVIADPGLNNASPTLKLRYTAGPGDDFLQFNRISDAEVSQLVPYYFQIKNKNLTAGQLIEFVDDTQKITFSNDASTQQSYIQASGARLTFNATNVNPVTLNQRIGYQSGFSAPSDSNSFLTKQEIQDLISASGGSGGGGSGGSTLSRQDGSLLALQDASRLILSPNNSEDVTLTILGQQFTGKFGMVCDQLPNGKRRIAGSSVIGAGGLELHPSQGDYNLHRLNISATFTTCFVGPIRYDASVFENSPIDGSDLMPKSYIDTAITNATQNKLDLGSSLSNLSAPTSAFSFGSQRLQNLGEPVNGQDAATRQWVLAQLQNLGFSQYPASYSVVIEVGDVPSAVETFRSTGDKDGSTIVASVTYNNVSASIGFYTVALQRQPFGGQIFEVIPAYRSLRTTAPDSRDNDTAIPLITNKTPTEFRVYVEETASVGQNVAIVCLIVPAV